MTNDFGLTAYRGDTGQQFQPRSGFKSWLLGNPGMFRQTPKYNPEIQGQLQQLLQQGFQGLQNPYQGFDNISNEATRQFETQTIPGIAERFTGMGGGQRSSAFQAALAGSGEDFKSKLAAMKEMFGQRSREQALGQIGFGLKGQPEFTQYGRQGGALQNLLGPLLGNQADQQFGQGSGEWIKALAGLLPYLI